MKPIAYFLTAVLLESAMVCQPAPAQIQVRIQAQSKNKAGLQAEAERIMQQYREGKLDENLADFYLFRIERELHNIQIREARRLEIARRREKEAMEHQRAEKSAVRTPSPKKNLSHRPIFPISPPSASTPVEKPRIEELVGNSMVRQAVTGTGVVSRGWFSGIIGYLGWGASVMLLAVMAAGTGMLSTLGKLLSRHQTRPRNAPVRCTIPQGVSISTVLRNQEPTPKRAGSNPGSNRNLHSGEVPDHLA